MDYQVLHLRDSAHPGANQLIAKIRDLDHPGTFGIFAGLLGLASNEIYVVTYGEALTAPPGVETVARIPLAPTARPTAHEPRDKKGVYVFRWFTVDPRNVDEIVRLSAEAWKTFETSFDTEVQGLFHGTEDPHTMLLITWYVDLSAWEASRFPPEAARENFLKRHHLTLSAKPIATRLVSVPDAPASISDD